jgi:hypothetical protein
MEGAHLPPDGMVAFDGAGVSGRTDVVAQPHWEADVEKSRRAPATALKWGELLSDARAKPC